MPNWCNNTLEISHEDKSMMDRVKTAIQNDRFLAEFIPVPEDLNVTASPASKDEELQAVYAKNKEKHGYSHWYDFCVSEWGTKWDICEARTHEDPNGNLTVGFETAWSPPISAYQKLSDMGFSIRAYYFEGGMMFCGKWENGDEEFYEIETCNSKWVKENIPSDIDDYMGISDCMELDEECEHD